MKEVVYAKYSNERDDKFKIKTLIVRNENQSLSVEKHPLTVEAAEHIQNIARYEKILSDYASTTKFRINKCKLQNDYAGFEYLEGQTLANIITEFIHKKDYTGLLNIVQDFYHELELMASEHFKPVDTFKKVFGEVELDHCLKACSISNIDMIFSNIIINNDGWNVIDYEWTFEFCVPINYVFYRAVINSEPVIRTALYEVGIFKLLGIHDAEIRQYERMDQTFLAYVKGSAVPLCDFDLQKSSTLDQLFALEKTVRQDYFDVFYDTGNGFNLGEREVFSLNLTGLNQVKIKVKSAKDRPLRIDPGNYACIVDLLILHETGRDLQLSHTGFDLDNGRILFCTDDPQMIVDGADEEVEMAFYVQQLPEETAALFYKTVKEGQELVLRRDEENAIISALRDELMEQKLQHQSEYNQVCHQAELAALKASHQAELVRLQHQTEIAEMESRCQAELDEAETRYQTNLSELTESHQAELNEAETRYQTKLSEYQAELDEAETRYQTNLSELTESHQAELNEAETRYQTKLSEYQAELDEAETRHQEKYTALNEEKEGISKELATYKEHYFAAIYQREELKKQVAELELMYNTIADSSCWKITKPLRSILDLVKRLLKSNHYTCLCYKGLKCLRENGFHYTWQKVQDKLQHRQDYLALANRPLFTEEELQTQRQHCFSRDVKFSIVVPLYNTPIEFLHEMIRSVMDQTYANWELCMADGSDASHGEVGKVCRSYSRKDHRIKYKKLEKNLGISGNTNACLDMAEGDYIGLFDHDDLLHPAALYEVMKAICEQGADFIYTDENTFHHKPEDAFCPHFKPDFAPDTLRSYNYICHFTVFEKKLMEKAGGGFRSEFDGSQDYDMVLRLTEQAQKIVHIPKILYYWRSHVNSVASDISAKPYTMTAAKRALTEHLNRVGLKGEVCDSRIPSTYQIRYEIIGKPLISILIPNKDHIDDLKKCIDSIVEKTTYKKWEIIVIENNSTERKTFEYYKEIQRDKRIHVVYWKHEFNYSAINNFGAKSARGDYVLLLNNDVEIITPDWLEQMLMFAQRNDVGAVGAMLYYPDDTVQHAGVILGIGGVAGHAHKHFPRGDYGYMSRMTIAQNYSVVTAACVLIPRTVWTRVNGLDEAFKVAFNDVDLCMRIREAGYLVVWTPYAELYHYESKSRGYEDTPEKQKRFEGEVLRFQGRWKKELEAGDPYYNPNFTLDREDFSLK